MFYLLSHERELLRQNSTSSLVLTGDGYGSAKIIWHRTEIEKMESSLPHTNDAVLIYPTDDAEDFEDVGPVKNYILLDGTWQEARKIYNRSPYLKKYRSIRLSGVKSSEYILRRNQNGGGLCTAEVVIEILLVEGRCAAADNLYQKFKEFQKMKDINVLRR